MSDWLHPFERYWLERMQALNDPRSKAEIMIEPGLINCTQFIARPPAKVWAALTDPALLTKWWATRDVRPIVGHRFTLDMRQCGHQPCEVLAVETERLLAYSFAPGTLNATISVPNTMFT